MKDPIISVKDLLAECVRKATLIVVCGIIVAIALCGFKYWKDVKSLGNDNQNQEIEFSDEQKYQIYAYVTSVEQLENIKEYVQDSIYMNCNPYKIDALRIQLKVESFSVTDQREALLAIRNYILDGGLAADLSKKDSKINAEYFSELLNCESITNESTLDNGIIEIVMYAENENRASEYTLWINENISAFVSQLNKKGINCSITKLEESKSTIVDLKMIENKNKVYAEVAQLELRVTDSSALLSVEQLAEANSLLLEHSGDKEDSTNIVAKPSISIKYFVLGGILGCAIAVVWIAVLYVFTNTIKISEDIQNMYGITCLGHLSCEKQTVLVKLANKLFYPEKNFDLDLQKAGVISKVVFCAKHNGLNSVVLVKDSGVVCAELEKIAEEISKNGVVCQISDNLSLQKDTMDVKSVVYVDQIQKTKYQSVENEILFCKNQNINVLGYITVK